MADNSDLKLKYIVEVLKQGSGAKDAATDFEKLGASAGKAESGVGGMAAGALKAARAFAALVVVQQIVDFVVDSTRAFEAAERAAKQLDGTLRALGRYTPELSGYLKQLASDLEDATKVDDKEILGAIGTLLQMGATAETVGPMVQRALDMSADGSTSLAAASEALGRAMQGEFGSLGRMLGKRFEEDAGRAENYAEAIRLVDERFRGLAAATAASDNSLKGLSHQWGELKENFGELISEFIAPLIRGLVSAVKYTRELFALFKRDAGPAVPMRPPAEEKTPEQVLAELHNPSRQQREMQQLLAAQQVAAAQNAVGLPLALPSGMAGRSSPLALLTQQTDAQVMALVEAREKNLINEREYKEQLLKITQQYDVASAGLAQEGVQAEQQMNSLRVSAAEAAVVATQRRFAEEKEKIAARYDYEIARAQESGQATEEIERRKRAAMERTDQLSKEAQWRVSETGALLVDVGARGAQAFSGGLASAIVNAARTGKAAFSEFFASFMSQVAQMIMQALLLRAVAGIMGGFGASPGLIKAVTGLAAGGFAPRLAAAGIIAGTQVVSGPTYFPAFNTIAGEAGSEVLAVLSKPRMMNIGGMASYVGSVQGQRVAMTNADDLARSAGGRGGAGGVIVVEVRGTREFEARVIDSSIEGAVVRVVNDLHTDTPVSAAVKGLTA